MKKRILAIGLILCLLTGLFAGCGKEETEGTQQTGNQKEEKNEATEIQYAYKAEYMPLTMPEDAQVQYVNQSCLGSDSIWLSVICQTGMEVYKDPISGEAILDEYGEPMEMSVTETRIFRLDLQTMAMTETDYRMPELEEGMEGGAHISSMEVDSDDTLWITEQVNSYYFDLPEDFNPETDDPYLYYTNGPRSISRIQIDKTGAELQRIVLEVPEEVYVHNMTRLEDGTLCSSDGMNLYFFGADGKLTNTLPVESGVNMVVRDGSGVAFTTWNETGLVLIPVDLEALTLGEPLALPRNAYSLSAGMEGYDFTYENGGTIYGFQRGSTEAEKLFSWMDCDVDSSYIGGSYSFAPDGTVYALEEVWQDGSSEPLRSLIVVKKVDASTLPQKQILTLACMYLDWDLRTKIIEFNKAHDDVRIVINDYSQYATDEDYYAGLQKLNTEILSGIVPDLFFLGDGITQEVYGAKGILQDLWPLIDSDPELGRDDLMVHLFESISMDGKLYQIVENFSIETLIGRQDVIGTADSWDLEGLMAAFEGMPEGATIFGETTVKNDMRYSCIERTSNTFVDWATQQCSFESQEFIDLLNFVNSFPAEFDYENYDWSVYSSEGQLMREKKQMLQRVYLSSFDQVQNMWLMCDGAPNYIGYPSTIGNGSAFQIYGGLAMSASCKNQAAAWEFMRQYLTEEHQTSEYMWNFPTNRHSFETYVQQVMTPNYTTDPETGEQVEQPRGYYWFGDGEDIPYYAMSQAEYDQFMALYEKTNGVASYTEAINNIIREETEPFFAGEKTAEETAKLIQNRAGLYVFEQG